MSASNSTPYGVKSLLECMSRATLLAQPDDITEFLSTHVDEMKQSRDNETSDTKEVALKYQEQWEIVILKEKSKKTEIPETVRIPSPQESVDLTAEEIAPFSLPPRPVSLQFGERIKKCYTSLVKTPQQRKKQPSIRSPWPELPPLPKKKPTKDRHTGAFTCRLDDCPYHNKPTEGSEVDIDSGPVKNITEPTVKMDLALQSPMTSPSFSELQIPYRPKGGLIIDPELVQKRTKARPVTKKENWFAQHCDLL